MYINLIDQLSELDKTRIENYVKTYGAGQHFIGIDKWLASWSHANQKLYKLLGNQLIYKEQIRIEKDEEMLKKDFSSTFRIMDNLNDPNHPTFYRMMLFLRIWYEHFITHQHKDYYEANESMYNNFFDLIGVLGTDWYVYYKNSIENNVFRESTLKIKSPVIKKTFQCQKGSKPIKVLQNVINFIKAEVPDLLTKYNERTWNWDYVDKTVEDFRIKMSMLTNDKVFKGNFCISIHPMDFITMSDNASGWTSCMNWADEGGGGCYHVGTVEMMNSNNVVCCYLESSTPYCFGEIKFSMADFLKPNLIADGVEVWSWNNKKYRVLGYVNKDIIMTGKSYPYYSYPLAEIALNMIKKLAQKNMEWTYKYGIEPYKDMIHIYSETAMDNNKYWVKMKKTTKKNIIWDTKGMYNDMLNDHNYNHYWCYRNPVKSTRIYSVSGKAPCLCCGNTVLEARFPNGDYNSRYEDTGSVVCETCKDKYFRCSICGDTDSSYIKNCKVTLPNGKELIVCPACAETFIRRCPCCGKPFLIDSGDKSFGSFIQDTNHFPVCLGNGYYKTGIPYKEYNEPAFFSTGEPIKFQTSCLTDHVSVREDDLLSHCGSFDAPYLERIFMCDDCFKKNYEDKLVEVKFDQFHFVRYGWGGYSYAHPTLHTFNMPDEELQKFFARNLVPVFDSKHPENLPDEISIEGGIYYDKI